MSRNDQYNDNYYDDYDEYDSYESARSRGDDLDDAYERRYGNARGGYADYDDDYYDDYEEQPVRQRVVSRGQASSSQRQKSSGRQTSRDGSRSTSGARRQTASSTSRRSNAGSSRNRSSAAGRKSSKGKKGSGAGMLVVTLLLIVLLGGIFGAKLYLDKYSYSKEKADLTAWFEITDESDVPIVWGNEVSEVRARLINGSYYMALDDVKANLNDRFYYGVQNSSDETGHILYALPTQLVRTEVGSNDVSVGDSTETKSYTPAIREGETIYLALDFVQEYTDYSYTAFADPNRIQILNDFTTERQVATITKDTALRTSGGIKSDVMEDVSKGATVTIVEQMDEWSKVRSGEAIIGYVENKRLSDITTTTDTDPMVYTEPEYASTRIDVNKVNLAFHNVWGSQGNYTLESYTANTQAINVVAPTWYWVNDNDGNMDKAGEASYVQTAHNLGYQVWAVVDNFNSSTLPSHSEFLATYESRQNLINQLIDEQRACGFEGINVDFEQVDSSYGDHYIEFIRELSIACRNNGIILSVDNYPSYAYNAFYDMGEQAVFADYIVLMSYDEHYEGSTETGSVSTLTYVNEAIQMALADGVPNNKLINAVPFYARIWWSTNGAIKTESHGMQDIEEFITNHGLTKSWNAEAGQYYAEGYEGDTLIQIWVEDKESLQAKIDAMKGYDLAGIAEWRLLFETSDVWDVIAAYVNS